MADMVDGIGRRRRGGVLRKHIPLHISNKWGYVNPCPADQSCGVKNVLEYAVSTSRTRWSSMLCYTRDTFSVGQAKRTKFLDGPDDALEAHLAPSAHKVGQRCVGTNPVHGEAEEPRPMVQEDHPGLPHKQSHWLF